MRKKEIILLLILVFLASPIFAEEYIPIQESVAVINEVKETLASLPEDLSLSSGTIDSLITKCEETIKTDEKYTNAYVYLGICYLLKEQFDEAVNTGDKVAAIDSSNPDGYFLRGFALMIKSLHEGTTSFADVISDFEKVLSLNPEYISPEVMGKTSVVPEILLWEGTLYFRQGENEKAKEIFQRIIDKYSATDWAKNAQDELERASLEHWSP